MTRILLAMLVIAVIIEPQAQAWNRNASYCAIEGMQSTATKKKEVDHADLRVLHAAVPMYPALARVARVSGMVEISVTVKGGLVVGTDVISGRQALLTRAAADNIKSWVFPEWVNTVFTTKFDYRLENKKHLDPQNPRVELQLPFFVRITAAARP